MKNRDYFTTPIQGSRSCVDYGNISFSNYKKGYNIRWVIGTITAFISLVIMNVS
jgi:hypothetical protein